MSAPDDFKERVRAATDIRQIIGEHVPLEREGDHWKGRCPFHPDNSPSFTVYVGQDPHYHCYGCPAHGDVFTFLMQLQGRTFPDVLDELASRAGVSRPVHQAKAHPVSGVIPLHDRGGLTLEALADAKKLPLALLEGLGCCNSRRNGVTRVQMPYPDTSSNVAGIRYRLSLKEEPRFIWRKGDHVMPYGLAQLAHARKAGYVLWVEGESDCWTAWHYGLPAIGVPGKATFRAEWAQHTSGLTNYLWVEPDADDLLMKMAQAIPDLLVIHAPTSAKDISDAHIQGQDVPALLEVLRSDARPAADILRELQDARIKELRARAAEVLASDDPVKDAEAAIVASGYGGDVSPVLTSYLAATSRLLEMRPGAMPVHTLYLAPASSGKSYALKTMLTLVPPDAYHIIDAGSPSTLIYDQSELQHKVVVYSEADSLPAGEDSPAASAIRNLLQDHRLHYQVTIRDAQTGEFTVKDIDKPGPSVLMTTSTRRLGEQLMSRLYKIEIPDDQQQIQAALKAQASLEVYGGRAPSDALIAYQAFLQALAPWRVVVPFAAALADAIGRSPAAPRLLRDYSRLLSLIKSVTVLRQGQRRRDADGRLVARIEDYATVYELVKDVYAGSVTGGASAKVREVVKAVEDLRNGGIERVTVTMVAEHCGINKMAASRRIADAERGGWLTNVNERKNSQNAKHLDVGEPLPMEVGLPSPADIAEACNSVTADTVRQNAGDNDDFAADARAGIHQNGTTEREATAVKNGTHLKEMPPGEPLAQGEYRVMGGKTYRKASA